jgi:hypothetical protein
VDMMETQEGIDRLRKTFDVFLAVY